MRCFNVALIITLLNISSIFSQRLPDFMVSNTNDVTRYFSGLNFTASGFNKVDGDFLFTSRILPEPTDTIVIDTLFFGFVRNYVKMRIKKISISRNGVEIYSVDSFPISATLKWKTVDNIRKDSILLRDSLLDIRLTSDGRQGLSKFQLQLDKKYTIVRNDVFEMLLDTIPLQIITGLKPRQDKSTTTMSFNNCVKVLTIKQDYSFLEGRLSNTIFNLAGKKQLRNNKTSNINIAKNR